MVDALVEKNLKTNKISKNKINIYICDSSGHGHVNLPIIIEKKIHRKCFFAMIRFTTAQSSTTIRQVGQGVIKEINGKHNLFFIGFCDVYWNPRPILPDKIEFTGISFIHPFC
jgi:hypothetical protein